MFEGSEHVGWRRYAVPVGLVLVLESIFAICVVFSPTPSAPPKDKEKNRSYVAVVQRSVSLPKAAVVPSVPKPETKQAQPPKVESPAPKTPPVASVEPVAPKTPPRAATRAPRGGRKMRRTKARKKSAKPRSPKTVRPKTLALDNLGMTTGVRVRASDGGGDSLGSPEVAPSDVEEAGSQIGNGDGVGKGKGTSAGSGGQGAPGRGRPMPPKVIRRVKGKYPSSAPKLGRRIPVTLALRINDKGFVETARVVSKPASAGNYFDKAAIAAVRKTRFRPAQQNGKAIPFNIRWTVFFDPPE